MSLGLRNPEGRNDVQFFFTYLVVFLYSRKMNIKIKRKTENVLKCVFHDITLVVTSYFCQNNRKTHFVPVSLCCWQIDKCPLIVHRFVFDMERAHHIKV